MEKGASLQIFWSGLHYTSTSPTATTFLIDLQNAPSNIWSSHLLCSTNINISRAQYMRLWINNHSLEPLNSTGSEGPHKSAIILNLWISKAEWGDVNSRCRLAHSRPVLFSHGHYLHITQNTHLHMHGLSDQNWTGETVASEIKRAPLFVCTLGWCRRNNICSPLVMWEVCLLIELSWIQSRALTNVFTMKLKLSDY